MSKPERFEDERSGGEIVFEVVERNLEEALRRYADAQDDVAIWQLMLTNLRRAAAEMASDRSDAWRGLEVPPRSAMH